MMEMSKAITVFWSSLVAVLILILAWQALSPHSEQKTVLENVAQLPSPDQDGFIVPGMSRYESMLDRPLFNPDRKPQIKPDIDMEEGAISDEAVMAEQKPLEVEVSGIIIMPKHKIVLLTDKTSNEKLRIREGESLEGEYAAWKLTSLSSREVVFENAQTGEQSTSELQVYGKVLKGGPKAEIKKPIKPRNGNKKTTDADKKNGVADADEIRRKVAERRAKMRAEAAKKRAKRSKQES